METDHPFERWLALHHRLVQEPVGQSSPVKSFSLAGAGESMNPLVSHAAGLFRSADGLFALLVSVRRLGVS